MCGCPLAIEHKTDAEREVKGGTLHAFLTAPNNKPLHAYECSHSIRHKHPPPRLNRVPHIFSRHSQTLAQRTLCSFGGLGARCFGRFCCKLAIKLNDESTRIRKSKWLTMLCVRCGAITFLEGVCVCCMRFINKVARRTMLIGSVSGLWVSRAAAAVDPRAQPPKPGAQN